ncbi:MAG: zinc-ribbon domain-containing protein [Promethearchaeota archaeon]
MTNTCSNCGAKIPDDITICPKCGAPISIGAIETKLIKPGFDGYQNTYQDRSAATNTGNLSAESKSEDSLREGLMLELPSEVNINLNESKLESLPFIGYKLVGDNKYFSNLKPLGAMAFNGKELMLDLNERYDLEIDMSINGIQQKKEMKAHVLISPPSISGLTAMEREFLDVMIEPPLPIVDEEEVYLKSKMSDNLPVDYGYLIWSYDEKGTSVIPIVSSFAYRDLKQGASSDRSSKLDVDWNQYNQKFSNDPMIIHELESMNEKFRWDAPLEIFVEIENPLLSIVRALETNIKDKNLETLNNLLKSGKTPSLGKLEELLKEYLSWYNWGDLKSFGVLSRTLRNVQMAQIQVVIQNNTPMQIFNSDLENINFSIEFPKFISDLMIPSNVSCIAGDFEGFVDLRENRILFKNFNLEQWGKKRFILGLSWDVLVNLDRIKFIARGRYKSMENILGSLVYANPMGFPIKISENSIEWNPGRVERADSFFPYYKVDENVVMKRKNKPAFYQEVNVDLGAIQIGLERLRGIFESAFAEAEGWVNKVNELDNLLPKRGRV